MAVLRMHVAVDQIARLIAVEQRQEGLKAAVGKVLRVAEAAGRGVRKHDIDAARAADLPAELPDAGFHLPLGVLVPPPGIQGAAAKTHDPQAAHRHELVFDALAALRRAQFVVVVMVPPDIEQGRAAERGEKRQIFGLQIPAREHQVILPQTAGLVRIPEIAALLVRKQKQLHSSGPLFFGWSASR